MLNQKVCSLKTQKKIQLEYLELSIPTHKSQTTTNKTETKDTRVSIDEYLQGNSSK